MFWILLCACFLCLAIYVIKVTVRPEFVTKEAEEFTYFKDLSFFKHNENVWIFNLTESNGEFHKGKITINGTTTSIYVKTLSTAKKDRVVDQFMIYLFNTTN